MADAFRLVFVACVIYTVLACPSDTNLTIPICKAMWIYRESILQPHVR